MSDRFISSKDIHEENKWYDLTEGLMIYEPATSVDMMTGEWRTQTPVFWEDKCKQCLLCVPVCPDASIPVKNKKRLDFDYDHCKGCGICVKVCPFGALTMEPGASIDKEKLAAKAKSADEAKPADGEKSADEAMPAAGEKSGSEVKPAAEAKSAAEAKGVE